MNNTDLQELYKQNISLIDKVFKKANEYRSEIERLKTVELNLQTELREKDRMIEKLKAESQIIDDEISSLQAAQEVLNRVKDKFRDAETEFKNKSKALDEKQQALSQSKVEADEKLKAEIEKLRQENDRLNNELIARTEELEQLKVNNSDMDNQDEDSERIEVMIMNDESSDSIDFSEKRIH